MGINHIGFSKYSGQEIWTLDFHQVPENDVDFCRLLIAPNRISVARYKNNIWTSNVGVNLS